MLGKESNQRPHVHESAILTTRPQSLLYYIFIILLSNFEHVCNFRRVQLSITVNIRHCMRMNNFLSEADLASINICFNQNYK